MDALTSNIAIENLEKSRLSELDPNNIPFGKIFSDRMFVADYANGRWQNAKIVPYGKLDLSPATSALHYGQAVFEGMKAYKSSKGEPLLFRPKDNFHRINRSAQRLCMPSIPEDLFMEGLRTLIELDVDWIPTLEDSALYVRPVYFATDEFIGLRPSESYKLLIISCPVGAYYSHPVRLRVADDYVRACQGGTGEAKAAGNYAASLLADKKAKQQGYDNVLWLDAKHRKYIEECGTMNLFFVIDGVAITPKLTGTILPGITRDSVMTLLRDKGVTVEERAISIDEVAEAHDRGLLSEVFGTGTAATIAHVDVIHYQGRDLNLSPVDARPYGPQLLRQLENIKTSKAPDPYGWVMKLRS